MQRFLICAATGFVLVAGVAPALAQAARPERPYRGLFGSGTAATGQLLTASGSLGAGFDDDLEASVVDSGRPEAGGQSRSGVLGNVSGSLAYSVRTGPFSFGASGSTAARYYPSAEEPWVHSSVGSVGLSTKLTEGLAFVASGTVGLQPQSFASVFPSAFQSEPQFAAAQVPDLGLVANAREYVAYTGTAALSQRVSRKSSLSATYSYRAGDRRFVYQDIAASYIYNIGKGLNLRAGYGYGTAQFSGGAEPVVTHTIDAGVDFARALSVSLSRRTTLSFGTGTSATQVRDRFLFTATGDATLVHEIGRTWSAAASYNRGLTFNENWREPVMSDSVTVGVGGLISRRLQFSSAVYGALSTVGLTTESGGFDSYYATTSLSYAMSRFINASVAYSYYNYRFDDAVVLPPGAVGTLSRQTIVANVSMWAPIFQRTRRP